MRHTLKALALAVCLVTTTSAVMASPSVPDHAQGKPSAPITIVEYSSFTCSHCADFYNNVMPEIEKNYIETGKVRIIHRDFPNDGFSLKAAALSRCMPEAQYFPFVKLLFKNFASWVRTPKPDETLLQYAQMSGLPTDKAKACMEDTSMLDGLVTMRNDAVHKYKIEGTPTFIINDGEEKIVGTQPYTEMAATFDKILASKKK